MLLRARVLEPQSMLWRQQRLCGKILALQISQLLALRVQAPVSLMLCHLQLLALWVVVVAGSQISHLLRQVQHLPQLQLQPLSLHHHLVLVRAQPVLVVMALQALHLQLHNAQQ